MSAQEFGAEQNAGWPLAFANANGTVEWGEEGGWSGRRTPAEARDTIDALHAAVHAAADAAELAS